MHTDNLSQFRFKLNKIRKIVILNLDKILNPADLFPEPPSVAGETIPFLTLNPFLNPQGFARGRLFPDVCGKD
jgi:hypothetical protein